MDEDFIQYYDESYKKCILEIDVRHPKKLHELQSDPPFLPVRRKIGKCGKLVSNLYDKVNFVIHIRALKQSLHHGLILERVHRVIEFNQEAWFKSYIGINTEFRSKTKNDFDIVCSGVSTLHPKHTTRHLS